MKIVFSMSGSQPSTFDPIVAEEITVISNFMTMIIRVHWGRDICKFAIITLKFWAGSTANQRVGRLYK